MRTVAVLDAPSNLGLRPPKPGTVPGTAKAPGALREAGLLDRLDAEDAGHLVAPRYDRADWQPGDGVFHAAQIAAYADRLAARVGELLDSGRFPVVLGGDCGILLGTGAAARRHVRGAGLVYLDGHSDFRHPGNSEHVGAAAGEALALATGRGQADLSNVDGAGALFADDSVVLMGIRDNDEDLEELASTDILVRTASEIRSAGAARSAEWARERLDRLDGFWVHLDVDILDAAVMPAVDSPDPGGLEHSELAELLSGLVKAPNCLGVEVTVFDPDLDPDGTLAAELAATLSAGLALRP
ncbi:arginase family protein [Allokutzneria sp. A3M-2-11 16]|uniref:arginase family protein n=1 Tax=Allokutzneria sp. A3M-2-11 16 TaxID=2962043 RepID=UPI0020B79636|nr:arginase family protein [Allokutzneria sp. A3M-2-11 16]MCP3800145.1 arginase family protein [Allokutzneria sp. A3M-2-11 16]